MTRGYIFISEDEYEIRDITAFELIQARSEGRELFEETGGEDFEKNLIQQACMVSKGLFLRGEQAFENGRAVLEKLTAEEIESAAVQYQYEVSPPADDDSGTLLPESRKSTVWDENRKDMLKTAVYESGADEMNTQSGTYEQIIREILKSQVKYENGNTEDRIPDESFPVNESSMIEVHKDVNGNLKLDIYNLTYDGQTAVNMSGISDYFERDSRRYDGVISLL